MVDDDTQAKLARIAPAVAVILLCSCAPNRPSAPDELQASIRRCGLDGQITFKKFGSGKYGIDHMKRDIDFKRFECVLNDLGSRGIRVGFVGNEQVRP